MKTVKFLKILLIVVSVTSVQGCRKTPTFTVQGNVREFYSDGAIEDVQVTLSYTPLAFGTVSSGYESISSVQTDPSGDYFIEFEEPQTSSYRLLVRKENYRQEERVVSATNWSADEENIEDFTMYLDVQLDLNFTVNSFGGTALFQLGRHSVGCTTCCKDQQSYFIETDTNIACSVYGNQQIPYTLTRISQGSTTVETGVLEVGQGTLTENWSI